MWFYVSKMKFHAVRHWSLYILGYQSIEGINSAIKQARKLKLSIYIPGGFVT